MCVLTDFYLFLYLFLHAEFYNVDSYYEAQTRHSTGLRAALFQCNMSKWMLWGLSACSDTEWSISTNTVLIFFLFHLLFFLFSQTSPSEFNGCTTANIFHGHIDTAELAPALLAVHAHHVSISCKIKPRWHLNLQLKYVAQYREFALCFHTQAVWSGQRENCSARLALLVKVVKTVSQSS